MTTRGELPAGAREADRATPAGFQVVTPAQWNAARRARRKRRSCRIVDCAQLARLYPAGWLCDRHKPRPPADDAA